jgi:membrane-associated protease RseP (regulator of RpoE activity)
LGIHFAQEAQAPTNASLRSSAGVLVAAVQEPAPPPPVRVKKDVRIRVDSDDEDPDVEKHIFFSRAFVPFGPRLGVQLEDLTAEKARELKTTGVYGVLVRDIEANSPAAKAGIAKDDVIVEFAGEQVRSAAQLRRLVQETPPDRSVSIQVLRAGQAKTLTAKMEATTRPIPGAQAVPLPPMPPEVPDAPDFFNFEIPGPNALMYRPSGSLGISGDDLTRQLADYFGVKQGKGVLVREVVVGSAAEKAGVKAGDVIVKVNDTEVGSVPELRRALPKASAEKQKVTLTIVRDRHEQTISVELEPPLPPKPRQFAGPEMPGLNSAEISDLTARVRATVARVQAQILHLQQAWRENARPWQENGRVL